MKTEILIVILSVVIFIEWIMILAAILKSKPLNHLPTYNYPLEEVYFEITEIKSISFGYDIVEYTAIVSFFKKPNAKNFVYNEYKFYDKKDKYQIGNKLYLNKKQ